ncbi:hypothetical protein KL86DYS1_30016 [uncultured Dysgonomonas sp.]|uniref:Uncharacterized protein n=1 Tax=uncultured Dysgonomonas sp. TaxID=206096 RepID=A0A212JQ64_9BACT|nr:hypothetical protein KL86DYS1_30016 [uncultured Dysgonomonas sp.]
MVYIFFPYIQIWRDKFGEKLAEKPQRNIGWTILALSTGFICLPIFIFNKHLLTEWTILWKSKSEKSVKSVRF